MTRLFPLWAILFSALAWFQPALFSHYKNWIVPLLSVVMFGMGMTLHLSDFKRAFNMPGLILTGLTLQYSVMPLAAIAIATLLGLNPVLTAGMVLVGASPGGTASNVICYLARGNVALSITLTAISTMLAILLTPLIALLLIDTSIDVPAGKMLFSIMTMVIIPVSLGITVNHYLGKTLQPVRHVFPLVSVFAIVFIIAIIVALNANRLPQLGPALLFAVVLHNAAGLIIGYLCARALNTPVAEARTLAIEVGMQNSGLAVALAIKYFTASAALPGAIFSIWHNLSGSALATLWSKR
jgi:BASS family bile acid:Na+ symporter